MKRDLTPELPRGGVGQPIGHDSATLHVTGRANYTDDLPELRGTLYAAVGQSARAHARIRSIDLSAVRAAPVVCSGLSAPVPGPRLPNYPPVYPQAACRSREKQHRPTKYGPNRAVISGISPN